MADLFSNSPKGSVLCSAVAALETQLKKASSKSGPTTKNRQHVFHITRGVMNWRDVLLLIIGVVMPITVLISARWFY